MASFISSITTVAVTCNRSTAMVPRASSAKTKTENKTASVVESSSQERTRGRRAMVFAAAAAAVAAVGAGRVVAAEINEPKRGTAEAKKKYAAVCVTMPTAKICRK